jgi:hypothetical protein
VDWAPFDVIGADADRDASNEVAEAPSTEGSIQRKEYFRALAAFPTQPDEP